MKSTTQNFNQFWLYKCLACLGDGEDGVKLTQNLKFSNFKRWSERNMDKLKEEKEHETRFSRHKSDVARIELFFYAHLEKKS